MCAHRIGELEQVPLHVMTEWLELSAENFRIITENTSFDVGVHSNISNICIAKDFQRKFEKKWETTADDRRYGNIRNIRVDIHIEWGIFP